MTEHPLYRPNGSAGALRLSHFSTRREFHRLGLHQLVSRPRGGKYTRRVALPTPILHTRGFGFDRFHGDVSARENLVVNLPRPHLARIWRAAALRRLLAAAITGLESADERDTRGVILLCGESHVELVSPPARRLLREFFANETAARLPRALAAWLEAGAIGTFLGCRGERRLAVRRAGDALLLEEQSDALPLTARERDVLALVAQGKTNDQIAQRLWLSPGTVRKHLENTYRKLGVRTRTAAATRFLGLSQTQDNGVPTPD